MWFKIDNKQVKLLNANLLTAIYLTFLFRIINFIVKMISKTKHKAFLDEMKR
jgi:hypothetical protein